jgi:hypothetical protein
MAEPRRRLDGARDVHQLARHATLVEQAAGRHRVRRRDAQAVEFRELALRGVDRHRRVEGAAGKAELGDRLDLDVCLGDEIRAGDPQVDDAVLRVLGDVARPYEQQVDGSVRARHHERPLGHLEGEPRVRAQPERRLRHTALRGDRELQPPVLAGAREPGAHRALALRRRARSSAMR